jgi:hypothetical protein
VNEENAIALIANTICQVGVDKIDVFGGPDIPARRHDIARKPVRIRKIK